jgi:hypothetical protein
MLFPKTCYASVRWSSMILVQRVIISLRISLRMSSSSQPLGVSSETRCRAID